MNKEDIENAISFHEECANKWEMRFWILFWILLLSVSVFAFVLYKIKEAVILAC